uniref:Uncharacterized protein n=1 Tax=Otus sunia TaxID=257818 RepID=A0A8C8A9C8_9STRI
PLPPTPCCSLLSLLYVLTYGSAIQELQRRRIIKKKNSERSSELHKAPLSWVEAPPSRAGTGAGSQQPCHVDAVSLPALPPRTASASPPAQRRENM